jgi:WD40 repeat protein
VLSVVVSPTGSTFASAGNDGVIRLWNLTSGQLQETLGGYKTPVHCLAFQRDGSMLASGSSNGTVKLWELPKGSLRQTFSAHEGQVHFVAFSADGSVISAGADNTVKAFRVGTEPPRLVLSVDEGDLGPVALTRDGSTLASANGSSVRLVDAATGQPRATLHADESAVRCVAFSADGTTLAAGSEQTVRLRDVSSGRVRHTLEGHSSDVYSLAFSEDGATTASGDARGAVRLWDTKTGGLRKALDDHRGSVFSLAFSPDGSKLISAGSDQIVCVFDAVTGQRIDALGGPLYLSEGHHARHTSTRIGSVAFSPDSGILASTGSDQVIKLWDVVGGRLLQTLRAAAYSPGAAWPNSATFSPDGTVVAAAARLLNVYIELDGNVIAHTFYDDGGRADATAVWRYLKDPPIMVDDDATAVRADPSNPLQATLEGNLLVRIQHKTRVIAQARLSTLMLRRADEQTQEWFLPMAEVERTAGAAGLGRPSAPPREVKLSVGLPAMVAIFTLIFFGVLVAIAFLFPRRPRAPSPE